MSTAVPDQKITRFHATEMNCKSGEYKNWDKEMCLRFSKKLIDMLGKRKMGAIAVACDMDAIQTVFRKGDPETMKRRTYMLCMKAMMVSVGTVMQEIFPNDTVLLIHDHGNWRRKCRCCRHITSWLMNQIGPGAKYLKDWS